MANGANKHGLSREEQQELERGWRKHSPSELANIAIMEELRPNFCSNCSKACGRANYFCTSCGVKNANFRTREFFFFSGDRGLADLRNEECLIDHPHMRHLALLFKDAPFCSLCGINCSE